MKFPHFFIERPIFATVLSFLIVLVGGLTYFSLPVSQYPAGRTADDSGASKLPGSDSTSHCRYRRDADRTGNERR